MTPTRRIVLGGGLAAALWRLRAPARADGPAPAAEDVLTFEAALTRLQLAPAPAEPAAAYARQTRLPALAASLKNGSSPAIAPKSASSPRIPALIFICPEPARPTPPSKDVGYSGSIIIDEPKALDVDLDASGQIKDDFADPAIGRGSGRRGASFSPTGRPRR